jgi:hypothetical protein
MKQYLAVFAALTIALMPVFATAGPNGGGRGAARGGGGRPGGGGARSAPARPSGGSSRPAPSKPSAGGFNLKGDTKPSAAANRAPSKSTASRPSANTGNRPNANNNGNRPNVNGGNKTNNNGGNKTNVNGGNKANVNGGNKTNVNTGNRTNVNTGNRTNVNVSGNTINRTVVSNPVYVNQPAWGWNRGVVWAPAPAYYGGGFWGAMAIGVTSAAVFGAVVNSTTHTTYTSYQVQPNSPGATVLSNYHLTQTQCGGSNLVVIYGPNNSVVCALPNDLVAAGNYNLDTSTLSLTS